MKDATLLPALQKKSVLLRKAILELAYQSKSGHLGSAFSVVDILICLYYDFLNVSSSETRDRFILSKGHSCCALYPVLADKGFFPKEELKTYLQDGSRLGGHPSSCLLPGVEFSTGSLGHGLSAGAGMALAAKQDSQSHKTVVLLSDGECDEGSTWESILFAAQWKLDNLICIVDHNKIQGFGKVADVMSLAPFADKWESFGWHVQEVDGHDHTDILSALEKTASESGRPHVLIANTIKGKGVSFMENTVDWHYWSLSEEQFLQAMSELPFVA